MSDDKLSNTGQSKHFQEKWVNIQKAMDVYFEALNTDDKKFAETRSKNEKVLDALKIMDTFDWQVKGGKITE